MASKRLDPLPQTLRELKSECYRRGLLKKDRELFDTREELLYHMWCSHNLGRSIKKASILLLGSSGSGKSCTINHLFNLDERESICFAKTNDAMSETRTTTEYILSVDSDHYKTSGLKLGLVDTPGFNDTNGTKQDACNFYSIKKFYDQNMNGSIPNLILIIIQACDTRIQGTNSSLAKSLRCMKRLKLIDKKRPNVVAVITFSCSLGMSESKFTKNFARKKEIVNETIFQALEVTVPIVALENDFEELEKNGDYTLLPDGTLQVKNLYIACKDVMKLNGDNFAQVIFNAAFSSGPKKISIEDKVDAKNASKEALSKDESDFFNYFSKALEGGISDPLVQEAQRFISEKKLDSDGSIEVQHAVEILKRSGVEELTDLEYLSLKGMNLKEDAIVSPITEEFLKFIRVKDSNGRISENSSCVIAQGYNLLSDSLVPSQIFVYEVKPSVYGLEIPEIALIRRLNETKTFMSSYDTEESLIKDRLSHLNLSLDVDYKAFSFTGKAGFNLSSNTKLSLKSQEISYFREEGIFELNLGNFRNKNIILTEDFKHDVSLLPSKFDVQLKETRKKFERFFSRWGHFIVTKVTGGGSIEMRINSSAIASDTKDIGELKASIAASFSGGFFNVDASAEGDDKSTTIASSRRILASSTLFWNGGVRNLHKNETIHDSHLMDNWRNSLMKQPAMMTTDMYLEPISTIVQLIDEGKYEATYNGLKDFLGGNFKVVAKKQEEERILAEKRRMEAEELQRKKQAEEVNERDKTVENPKVEDSSCFPPNSTITILRSGQKVTDKLVNLKIGDYVMGYDVRRKKKIFSPMILWAHADKAIITSYLNLELEDGSGIRISGDHNIFVGTDHKTVMAQDIHPGEILYGLKGGFTKLISVTDVKEVGLAAPITAIGNLFVDGILASCYANIVGTKFLRGRVKLSAQTIGNVGFLPLRLTRMLSKRKQEDRKEEFGKNIDLHPYVRFLCKLHNGLSLGNKISIKH